MAKKSKHMTGTAFAVEVSDAIRHHIGCRKALESKRQNAFDDRDNALAELADFEDKHSPEAKDAKEKHSDAVVLIDDLNKRIKWHSNQVDETIEHADEPSFEFMYEPSPEDLVPKKKAQMEFGEGEKASDTKPIGKPGPVKPEQPDPDMGDGVDEHLKASVNELDLSEAVIKKLATAGLTKVGHITKILDSKDGDLAKEAKLTDLQEREVQKVVKTFRKFHRQAAQKAEGNPLGN